MTAFDAAADVLFENDDLSEAATYRVGGAGDGSAVRVIRSAPDRDEATFGARIIAPAIRVQIRISELANRPAKSDTITIGTETLTVRHALRDAERLTWEADCDG